MIDALTSTRQLINKRGLHARASAKFVTLAAQYDAEIRVANAEGSEVGGTSIMGLMMLGIACGEAITITTAGNDATAALAALVALVDRKFDEE